MCVRVWCGGVLLCGAHGDWGARFYGAKWRRVFVSDVSTDYNKRSSDLTYIHHKPQTLDLIVTKCGSSQQTYVRGLLAYLLVDLR